MKVDSQRLEEAREELIQLYNRLNEVEEKIHNVVQVFRTERFGDKKLTAKVMEQLYRQSDDVRRRSQSLKRLEQVLSIAGYEYVQCEQNAKRQAEGNAGSIFYTVKIDHRWLEPLPSPVIISPLREMEVIEDLIRPIIRD